MRNFTKFLLHSFRRSWPTRLKIGFMLFAGSFMIYMLRANFSIILLAMTQDYNWSSYEQNLLLSAYFCGYIAPNLIAGVISERFGGRIVIFFIFLVSSVITALVPCLTNEDFTYLFMSRLALGFCGGFFFCTCHNLISLWAPPDEKGIFMSSLLGSKLGTALTWPVMGIIINVLDWRWAFYISASLSFLFAIVWLKIVADSPEKHPNITKTEQQFIEASLEALITKKKDFPPISKMFKSRPFYALVFLHFSDVWGVFFLLTSAPMFMNQVLKYDLKHAGIVSSFPYIARLVFGFIFGLFGDHLMQRGVGATKIRKLFCIFSHIIPGILLFGFCFIENSPRMCILLITLSLGFNGAATMTSSQNPQDLAPNFAASVFGLVNFFATSSGFLSPLVVSYFTREKSTMSEWRYIFALDGTLYIASAFFFMLFGSAEVQKWNRKDSHKDLLKL